MLGCRHREQPDRPDRAGGRVFGVLSVHSQRQRAFSADDTSFAQGVANVLAAAVRRARDDEALREGEASLRLVLAGTRTAAWWWEVGEDRIRWSEGVAALHGLPEDGAPVEYEQLHGPDPSGRPGRARRRRAAQRSRRASATSSSSASSAPTAPRAGWRRRRTPSATPAGRTARLMGIVRDVTGPCGWREQRERLLADATELLGRGRATCSRRCDELVVRRGMAAASPIAATIDARRRRKRAPRVARVDGERARRPSQPPLRGAAARARRRAGHPALSAAGAGGGASTRPTSASPLELGAGGGGDRERAAARGRARARRLAEQEAARARAAAGPRRGAGDRHDARGGRRGVRARGGRGARAPTRRSSSCETARELVDGRPRGAAGRDHRPLHAASTRRRAPARARPRRCSSPCS